MTRRACLSRRVVVSVAAAVCVATWSCDDGVSPGSTLTTAVALSADTVDAGDLVDVEIAITNTGPNGITVTFPNVQQTGYRVTDLLGTVVAEEPQLTLPAISTRLFGPGATELYTMTIDTAGYASGTYRVRAGLLDEGARYPWATATFRVR